MVSIAWTVLLGVLLLGVESKKVLEKQVLEKKVPKDQAGDHYLRRAIGRISPKIVGGSRVTNSSSYPSFALWSVGCGASLIHYDILLTAAHCQGATTTFQTVRVGTIQAGYGTLRRVVDSVRHPQHNVRTNAYDFQLLKLNIPLDSTTTTLAMLNDQDDLPQTGDSLMVVGNGVTTEGSTAMSSKLRQANVFGVDDDVCRQIYDLKPRDLNVMFCAGTVTGTDSCQGDSGGPIYLDDKKRHVQVGIVSWGAGCGRPSFPGVYARVSTQLDWMKEAICELSDYPPDYCSEPDLVQSMDWPTSMESSTLLPYNRTNHKMTISFQYDLYPQETSWGLYHSETGTVMYEGTYDEGNPEQVFVLEIDNIALGSYYIIVADSSNDGMCCDFGEGSITIMVDNEQVYYFDGQFWSITDDYFTIDATEDTVFVVTNNETDDTTMYNSTHNVTQDEIVYNTTTYDATDNTYSVDNDPIFLHDLMITVQMDYFSSETSWSLIDPLGIVHASSPYGAFWFPFSKQQHPIQLYPGSYTLILRDLHGDGICCSFGDGYAQVDDFTTDTQLASLDGQFGFQNSIDFQVVD